MPNDKTLRDEFAMAALIGLLSDPNCAVPHDVFARNAYKFADAMMKERGISEDAFVKRVLDKLGR